MTKFVLPTLPYAFDALEPFIDKATMELHYLKHHNTYLSNFNKALEDAKIENITIEDIIKNISKYNVAIKNNGGGYFNHSFFWDSMKPNGGGIPKGRLAEAIYSDFGTFQDFKSKFSDAAASCFGSGWAWLIVINGKLHVTSTSNQENPLMDTAQVQGDPILTLDVWEHAYYLKYQNRRAVYIDNWWNVINWQEVAQRFVKFDTSDPFPQYKPL
jgi:superoxide dismutase, Fe-Mn family